MQRDKASQGHCLDPNPRRALSPHPRGPQPSSPDSPPLPQVQMLRNKVQGNARHRAGTSFNNSCCPVCWATAEGTGVDPSSSWEAEIVDRQAGAPVTGRRVSAGRKEVRVKAAPRHSQFSHSHLEKSEKKDKINTNNTFNLIQ